MFRRSSHYLSLGVWLLTLVVGLSRLEDFDEDRQLGPVVDFHLKNGPNSGVGLELIRASRRKLSRAPHMLKELGNLEKSIMGSRAESAAAAVVRKPNATAHHGTAARVLDPSILRPNASGAHAASFQSRPQLGSSNLTIFSKSDHEDLYNLGCKLIDDVPSADTIEQKKQSRSLKFALLYSGQVCHGRGADVLHHPAMMRDLWANHAAHVHAPLAQWGRVDLFGLFEEMSEDAITALTHTSAGAAQAAGCNDFAPYANWTALEFMTSEAHINPKIMVGTGQLRQVRHGEERRVESLKRFVGLARWRNYDFFLQMRPDIKFRRPITEWGINLRMINVPHWESNGMRECDTAKLTRAAAQGLVPIPTVGDAYFMYPQSCAPDLSTFMARDLHVVETIACHNTRSCLYHPDYYLYGERLCDEALRPGESPGEYCIRGSAGQDAGILGCAMSHARRWRATPLEGQRDEARWYALHYQPFTSVELFSCMERSKTGWLCPDANGGPCRKASCADVPQGPAASSPPPITADRTTSLLAATAKVPMSANATPGPLLKGALNTTSLRLQNASELRFPSRGSSEGRHFQPTPAVSSSRQQGEQLDAQSADAAYAAATREAVAAAKVEAQRVAEASGLAAEAATGDVAAMKRMQHDETALVNAARAEVGGTSPTGVEGVGRKCNRITGKCFMVQSG